MKKIDIVKRGVSFVVGGGVGIILNGIVSHNVDKDELNRFGRLEVRAATYVLGSVIGEKTKEYTDKTIDTFAESVEKIKESFEEAKRIARDDSVTEPDIEGEAEVVDTEILRDDIRNESS